MPSVSATIPTLMTSLSSRASRAGHTSTESSGPRAAASLSLVPTENPKRDSTISRGTRTSDIEVTMNGR